MTIPGYIFPIAFTIFCLVMMVKRMMPKNDYDFGVIAAPSWLIPACLGWIIYLAVH